MQSTGVFLYSKGTTIALACPGDRLPGGEILVTVGTGDSTYHLNNSGDVAFSAQIENNGVNETGVYIWSKGTLRLVAKTGTVIPGVGTIQDLGYPPYGSLYVSGGIINDRGQILFSATLKDTDNKSVLLIATPK